MWVMSLLFAALFVALGLGAYWMLERSRRPPSGAAALESPRPAGRPQKNHALQKFIEVTGVRLLQGRDHRTEARFLLVNHSAAEISDLAGTVTIWGRTQKSEEESVGSLSFRLPSLGPYESRELAAPLNTSLRVYELPDWQNITAEVQLTSP